MRYNFRDTDELIFLVNETQWRSPIQMIVSSRVAYPKLLRSQGIATEAVSSMTTHKTFYCNFLNKKVASNKCCIYMIVYSMTLFVFS